MLQHTLTQEKTMSNTNKSGFELRTEILGMAIGILENNRDQSTNAFYSQSEEERAGKQAPVIPISNGDIIATAKELYEFVNEK